MGSSEIAIFALPALVMVGALAHTYKSKKAHVAARWGAILIGVGSLAALAAAFWMQTGYDQVQVLFVSNFLIMVAGVGAGLLGSAATTGLER
jgi:hypothetical protein